MLPDVDNDNTWRRLDDDDANRTNVKFGEAAAAPPGPSARTTAGFRPHLAGREPAPGFEAGQTAARFGGIGSFFGRSSLISFARSTASRA